MPRRSSTPSAALSLHRFGQAAITTLTGANTYNGGTIVNAGTLTVGAGGTLGATTGPLQVNNPNTGAGTNVVLNLSTAAATTTGSLSGAIATPSGGTNTATINNGGLLFTVNQTAPGAYAGAIAGVGGFTLGSLSTSTLTLSGANTYTGPTTISSGTLSLTGTLGSGGGTAISSAATFNETSAGIIAGSSSLNVTGGTTTLAGANPYSGITTVSGSGTLRLTNAGSTNNIASSPTISVASAGATLDASGLSGGGMTLGASGAQNLNGVGTILSAAGTGATTAASGASLSPGVGTTSSAGTIGTLTFGTSPSGTNGNLTINSGATLNFVLGTPGANPTPGSASLIAVNGNLTLPTTGLVNVNLINTTGSGYYELFSYTGSLTNAFNPAIFTQSSGLSTYTYTNQSNQIDLQIATTVLTWTGQQGNTVPVGNPTAAAWDTGTANWANGATAGQTFLTGAIASFGDTYAGGSPVTDSNILVAAGGVQPGGVNFSNNSVTYTFNSADSTGIGGNIPINMTGAGTVNLAGPNSFIGAVAISSGVINISNNASLGNSSGVTLAGGVLQIQGNITTSNAVPLIFNGHDVSPTGALNNISGTNVYTGAALLNVASTIGVTAGTLTLTGGINNNGNLLTFTGTGNATVSTVGISGGGGLTYGGAGLLTLGVASGYTGTTTLNSGELVIGNNNALGSTSAPLTFNGGTLQYAPSATITDISGRTVTFQGSAAIDINGDNVTFANAIGNSGTGGLTLVNSANGSFGAGATLTLGGVNTYSGGTTIDGGTLSINTDRNLGAAPGTLQTANITINGGTLQVTATTALGASTIATNRGITLGASGGTINISVATMGSLSSAASVQYFGVIGGGAGGGNTSLTVSGGSGTNGGTAPYLLQLGGQSTYSGNTTINNATVCFQQGGNGGTGPNNILPVTTVLNLENNGWFVLDNGKSNQQIAGLELAALESGQNLQQQWQHPSPH